MLKDYRARDKTQNGRIKVQNSFDKMGSPNTDKRSILRNKKREKREANREKSRGTSIEVLAHTSIL
ncbi:hypothetical protein A9261_01555 [Vibrio tasmaniensis]|nr:hypothetical protein A9261_01555 [Vibrio tasmaniensis]